jgi:hypothetical protein
MASAATAMDDVREWGDPHFDDHQFVARVKIVSNKNAITFSDVARMHVHRHRGHGLGRRLPTPEWVNDENELRQTVLWATERRLYIRTGRNGQHLKLPEGCFTDEDRMDAIKKKADVEHERLSGIVGRLTKLHHEWLAEKVVEPMVSKLSRLISNFDTEAELMRRNPLGITLAVCYMYHRLRFDSPGVAEELKLKAPHIRQILSRVQQCRLLMEGKSRTVQPSSKLRCRRTEGQNPTKECMRMLGCGMNRQEYEYRRAQIKAAIHNRTMPLQREILHHSVHYGLLDSQYIFDSFTTKGRASDVVYNPATRRIELIREMVPAPAQTAAPMF